MHHAPSDPLAQLSRTRQLSDYTEDMSQQGF